jgi:hypothetical protein
VGLRESQKGSTYEFFPGLLKIGHHVLIRKVAEHGFMEGQPLNNVIHERIGSRVPWTETAPRSLPGCLPDAIERSREFPHRLKVQPCVNSDLLTIARVWDDEKWRSTYIFEGALAFCTEIYGQSPRGPRNMPRKPLISPRWERNKNI